MEEEERNMDKKIGAAGKIKGKIVFCSWKSPFNEISYSVMFIISNLHLNCTFFLKKKRQMN